MPNRSQTAKKNNRRRRRQTGSQRVAPTTEELERQYHNASRIANEETPDNDPMAYSKKFQENSPQPSIEFEIVKHKNLIKKKKDQIERCFTGLTMARMGAILHGIDNPEELEKFEKQIKLGEDRITDLTNWLNHSKLMVELFSYLTKHKENYITFCHDQNKEFVKEIKNKLTQINDNIHKVIEGMEVMVKYGSDFYTEREYNDLCIMFKQEFDMWSNALTMTSYLSNSS